MSRKQTSTLTVQVSLSVLLALAWAGCSSSGGVETFADLQRGAGGVPAAEVEALGQLLEKAGVAPEQFKVLKSRGGSLAKADNGFLIDGGHIAAIKLSGTKLSSMEALTPLKHLKGLSLSNNRIEKIGGLEHAAGLVSLDLSKNKLTTLEGLSACKGLRGLKASHNALRTTKGLSKGTAALRSLVLDHNELTELPEVAGHGSLVSLDVANNKLTSLEGLRDLKQLRLLRVTDNSLKTATGLGLLADLEELFLDRNDLTTLGEFPEQPKLVHLDLSQNQLAAVPASAAGVKGLLLNGNPLSTEARQAIIEAAPSCRGKARLSKGRARPQGAPLGCRGGQCSSTIVDLTKNQQVDLARSPFAKRPFEVRISTEYGSAKVIVADQRGQPVYAQAWPGRPCTVRGARAIHEMPSTKRRGRPSRRRPPPAEQVFVLVETAGARAKVVAVEIGSKLPQHESVLGEPPPPETDAGQAEPAGDGGLAAGDGSPAGGDGAPAAGDGSPAAGEGGPAAPTDAAAPGDAG